MTHTQCWDTPKIDTCNCMTITLGSLSVSVCVYVCVCRCPSAMHVDYMTFMHTRILLRSPSLSLSLCLPKPNLPSFFSADFIAREFISFTPFPHSVSAFPALVLDYFHLTWHFHIYDFVVVSRHSLDSIRLDSYVIFDFLFLTQTVEDIQLLLSVLQAGQKGHSIERGGLIDKL